MMKGSEIWNALLGNALRVKGARVSRDSFLHDALKRHCTADQIRLAIELTPSVVLAPAQLDAVAGEVIRHHRKLAAGSSFVAGLPGGYALLAAVPADTAQYLFHSIITAQKLAYIYGFHSFSDGPGSQQQLMAAMTVFVGVMFGVSKANEAINTLARMLADKAARQLVGSAAGGAALHPLLRVIGHTLGVELNKKTLGKALEKAIPVAGGVLSGGLTWVAFGKGARRLQLTLKTAPLLLPQAT